MKVTAVRSRTIDDAPLSSARSRECSSPGALAMSNSPVPLSKSESPRCSILMVSGPCFRMEIESNRVSLPRPSQRDDIIPPGALSVGQTSTGALDISGEGEGHAPRRAPVETAEWLTAKKTVFFSDAHAVQARWETSPCAANAWKSARAYLF